METTKEPRSIAIEAAPLSSEDFEIENPLVKIKAVSNIPSARYQGLWCFYLVNRGWYVKRREDICFIFPNFIVVQMDSPFKSTIEEGSEGEKERTEVEAMFTTNYLLLPISKFAKLGTNNRYYQDWLLPQFVGSNIRGGTRRAGLEVRSNKIKVLDMCIDGVFVQIPKDFLTHGISSIAENKETSEMIEATQLMVNEHINSLLLSLGIEGVV